MKKAAESILTVCNKEGYTKQDKTRLLALHEKMVKAVEGLKECDGCSSLDVIATITLNGVTAKMCKECGIKSLEAEKIKKKRARKRKNTASKPPQNKVE